jgi:peptidoglycan/LPS O-acetylase OafA/YrhL
MERPTPVASMTGKFANRRLAAAGKPTSGYIPAVDGLRAVSIMMVVLAHAGFQHVVPGGLGVDIFFVISGYLITSQMIGEVDATGRLNLGAFYVRRVFRLAPALLIYIAIMTPVDMLMGANVTVASVVAVIFYFANYWDLYVRFGSTSAFGILWSLSVEEHFYLFFPLLVTFAIPNLRRLMVPILVAGLCALVWRIQLAHSCTVANPPWLLCGLPQEPGQFESLRIYHGTDTRFDSILAGSFLALAAAYGPSWWAKILLGRSALYCGLVAVFLTLVIRNPVFRDTIRYTIQEAAIAVVVGNIVFSPGGLINSLLSLSVMTYIGRLSYSLYLYHFGVLVVLDHFFGDYTWRDPWFYLFFVASFALAIVSYHLVERPMVALRRRFGSHATRQTA